MNSRTLTLAIAVFVGTLVVLASVVSADETSGSTTMGNFLEEDDTTMEEFDILSALWDFVGFNRSTNEPLTLFAPTDSAFVAAAAALGVGDGLTKKQDVAPALANELESRGFDAVEAVTTILTYHIVEERLMAADVLAMKELQTKVPGEVIMRGGDDMEATQLGDGATSVRDPRIIFTDYEDSRGLLVHVIDGVLIPKAFATALDLFVDEGAGVKPMPSGKGCKDCEDDELCSATPWEKKKTALCLPKPPMCYLTLEKNKGSDNEAFVPYAPCCSGEESVMFPMIGTGSYCLP